VQVVADIPVADGGKQGSVGMPYDQEQTALDNTVSGIHTDHQKTLYLNPLDDTRGDGDGVACVYCFEDPGGHCATGR
jgi:hypothetical protein